MKENPWWKVAARGGLRLAYRYAFWVTIGIQVDILADFIFQVSGEANPRRFVGTALTVPLLLAFAAKHIRSLLAADEETRHPDQDLRERAKALAERMRIRAKPVYVSDVTVPYGRPEIVVVPEAIVIPRELLERYTPSMIDYAMAKAMIAAADTEDFRSGWWVRIFIPIFALLYGVKLISNTNPWLLWLLLWALIVLSSATIRGRGRPYAIFASDDIDAIYEVARDEATPVNGRHRGVVNERQLASEVKGIVQDIEQAKVVPLLQKWKEERRR